MVKIRLTRTGRKNSPSFRIVATDSRNPRDGKHLEVIGFFNPSNNPVLFEYKKDRYDYWVLKGAQPSKTVDSLIAGTYTYKKYVPKKAGEEDEQSTEENIEGTTNEKIEEVPKEEAKKIETESKNAE